MNAHEERERRRGGGQEGGSTTGQPPSPPRRRQRRTPRRNPAGRFSQSPPTPCSISLPKFGSRAPLAFFLVSVSMAGRDRAAAGPLRPPTGVHCSSAGGGGPVGGPEQPEAALRQRGAGGTSPRPVPLVVATEDRGAHARPCMLYRRQPRRAASPWGKAGVLHHLQGDLERGYPLQGELAQKGQISGFDMFGASAMGGSP